MQLIISFHIHTYTNCDKYLKKKKNLKVTILIAGNAIIKIDNHMDTCINNDNYTYMYGLHQEKDKVDQLRNYINTAGKTNFTHFFPFKLTSRPEIFRHHLKKNTYIIMFIHMILKKKNSNNSYNWIAPTLTTKKK